MDCPSCGTALPDEASYCWNCGQPQRPGVAAAPAWETCEILYTRPALELATCRFFARAVGAWGEFSAGESPSWIAPYPQPGDPLAAAAHQRLLRRLVAAGWQHTGRGLFWYNDRFQRRGRG